MTNTDRSLPILPRSSFAALLAGLLAVAACADVEEVGTESQTASADTNADAREGESDGTDDDGTELASSEVAATSAPPKCVSYRRGGTALGGGAVFYVTNACPVAVKVQIDFVGTTDGPCRTIGARQTTSFTSTRVQASKPVRLARC